jgi:ATP-dependent helicase/nuclease subunit B
MSALLNFVENPTFQNLRCCSDMPTLASRLGLSGVTFKKKDGEEAKIGWYRMQQQLDAVSAAIPPQQLDETIEFAQRQPTEGDVEPHVKRRNEDIVASAAILNVAQTCVDGLNGADWKTLGETLLALAQPMTNKETPHDEWNFASDVSQAIESSLVALESGQPEKTGLTKVDIVRLALQSAGGRSFRGDMDRHAVNLPGWMEIPWEPVPHLVIFGLTDDLVPGSRHAHPFLPTSLRRALGLPSSAQQFANAAYTLELVRCQRTETGRVDIIVPRLNDKGEGLRPSRLLMLSPEKEGDHLLGEVGSDGKAKGPRGRLDHLLTETAPPASEPAWVIPAQHHLNPTLTLASDAEQAEKRLTKLHNSISATAFKTYLEDPSQYWLKHALGMSASSHGEMELDAAGFGTLAHSAVEAFGKDAQANELSDAGEIQKLLEKKLDEYFAERFGESPGSTLLLQREMARARLQAFALSQAQLHGEGWRILEVEGQLPEIEIIEGFKLRGRFDRLDYNTDGTRFRVYDYKTFAEVKNPAGTHLYGKKPFNKGIELGQFEVRREPKNGKPQADKPYRWKDLQLPAYYWALTEGRKQDVGNGKLEVGYLCLSADIDAEPIQMWKDFEKDFFEASKKCMKDVATAISKRAAENFQPSAEPARYPVLEHLSGRRVAEYMDITKLGTAEKA